MYVIVFCGDSFPFPSGRGQTRLVEVNERVFIGTSNIVFDCVAPPILTEPLRADMRLQLGAHEEHAGDLWFHCA